MFKKSLSLIAVLFGESTNAWWNNGHLITARVAYDTLIKTNHSAALEAAEKNLLPLQYLNHMEGNHSFVECATFADYIKDRGFSD